MMSKKDKEKKTKKTKVEQVEVGGGLTGGEAAAATHAAINSAKITAGSAAIHQAGRRADLSELAAAAGVNDLMQGADLLTASEDIAVMSAAVAALNEEDLEDTMEIASISGELSVLADVLASLDMPTMAEFVFDRSERLHEIAVDNILRFGAMRALSEAMGAAGDEIGDLGEEEMLEGEARLDMAAAAADNSFAMRSAGEAMIAEGLAALAAAEGAEDMAAVLAEGDDEE